MFLLGLSGLIHPYCSKKQNYSFNASFSSQVLWHQMVMANVIWIWCITHHRHLALPSGRPQWDFYVVHKRCMAGNVLYLPVSHLLRFC